MDRNTTSLSNNFNNNTSAANARELRCSTRSSSISNADNSSNNIRPVNRQPNSQISDVHASGIEAYNPNRRLDPDVKREMLRLISYADEIDGEKQLFANPVRLADAPGYLDIVRQPMDRSKIR
jgi:hypothetical protein